MPVDIRDKTYISHEDVAGLNFIKSSGSYVFRRHYRQGLRSHVLEVLKREDVARERTGCVVDGVRWYPRAEPVKMLRIFRSRLATLASAIGEIRRVKVTERYLAPNFLARSSEFIVDYTRADGRDLMLCGLQDYVDGEIVDPWSLLDRQAFVPALYDGMSGRRSGPEMPRHRWVETVRKRAAEFIQRIKRMISRAGYIPDLAGIGNLVVIPAGDIKLVDINNISRVVFDRRIRLDDRGYPVCDKSIEALYLLEDKMAGQSPDRGDKLFRMFLLDPQRKKALKGHEEIFFLNKKEIGGYPAFRP